jgi:hypothetical protein
MQTGTGAFPDIQDPVWALRLTLLLRQRPALEKVIFHRLITVAGFVGLDTCGLHVHLVSVVAFRCWLLAKKIASPVIGWSRFFFSGSVLILLSVCPQYSMLGCQSPSIALASIARAREATSESFMVVNGCWMRFGLVEVGSQVEAKLLESVVKDVSANRQVAAKKFRTRPPVSRSTRKTRKTNRSYWNGLFNLSRAYL